MTCVTTGMVLCAGLGMRMRPLTDNCPKPLLEVAGRSLLDRTLDWYKAAGIRDVVINTHYLAPMVEAHVAKRRAPRVHLSHEPQLLETGGGIRKALPLLGDEPFFCANGDAICLDEPGTSTLGRMQQAWDGGIMDALLLIVPKTQATGFDGPGDFFFDTGKLRRRQQSAEAPYIFTGIQLLHPRLFAGSPEGPFSMNLLYDRHRKPDGALGRIGALVHDGPWLHVGDPQGLQQAEAFLRRRN